MNFTTSSTAAVAIDSARRAASASPAGTSPAVRSATQSHSPASSSSDGSGPPNVGNPDGAVSRAGRPKRNSRSAPQPSHSPA